MVFKKSSVIIHHSIFIAYHPPLIIHHLSLKIPQLPKGGTFGTLFPTSHNSIFCTFYRTHTWAPCQWVLLVYPPHTHFTSFSSLLISFCQHHNHSAKVQPKNPAKEPTTITMPLFLPKIFLQPCFSQNPQRIQQRKSTSDLT